jgi:chromosome segregation ATPase
MSKDKKKFEEIKGPLRITIFNEVIDTKNDKVPTRFLAQAFNELKDSHAALRGVITKQQKKIKSMYEEFVDLYQDKDDSLAEILDLRKEVARLRKENEPEERARRHEIRMQRERLGIQTIREIWIARKIFYMDMEPEEWAEKFRKALEEFGKDGE